MNSVEFRNELALRRSKSALSRRFPASGFDEPVRVVHIGELSIVVRQAPELCELALYGELGLASASGFEHEARLAEKSVGTGSLVIDLSGVSAVDAHGLGVLLGACRRARRGPWALSVLRPAERAGGTFRLLHQWDEIPFVD